MEINFINRINDLRAQCLYKNIPTYSKFLNISEQLLIIPHLKNAHYKLDGGYESAERKTLIFYPDYDVEANNISLVRVTKSKLDTLEHKDYLGSLMALNIKRECIGDITLHDTGADIFVITDILEFVLLNYNVAGRKTIKPEHIPLENITVKTLDTIEKVLTVSSMRLDVIISNLYNVSRNASADAIKSGKISINSMPALKNDIKVKILDLINFRGKGRIKITDDLGISAKGKIKIVINK